MDNPSDTFFTLSPEWGWLIVAYFFLGGIAGGSAFLAGLLDLFGRPEDRPTARIGHLLAAPLMAICGLLLVVDLTRPERFWHMVVKSNSGWLMFKWYSPISFGVWVVGLFSLAAALAFVGVLAERGILPRGLAALREGTLGWLVSVGTAGLGIFLCGYTGVLLAVTNRPLWSDTTLLGLLFLLSGVSAAAALLTLLAWRRGHPATIHWLGQMDAYSSIFELIVLALIAASIWSVAEEVWGGGWGLALALGFVVAGVLAPLALHLRPRLLGQGAIPAAAILVLVGSFVLRAVVVMATESI